MSKDKILEIISFLKEQGLLTNSLTHDKVFERYKNSDNVDEVIQFILTSGMVKGNMRCRTCNEEKPANQFSFYQTRVQSDGYLMRSNAICSECSGKINKERRKVLDGAEIPPKPAKGSVCPRCNRIWEGQWHRHHDDDTKEFVGWLCGNCNMSLSDQRNPGVKR